MRRRPEKYNREQNYRLDCDLAGNRNPAYHRWERASCTAYHIYVAATATPQSDEARSAEDKATTFLLAAYARMPDEDRGAAEARIEGKVKGLFEDSASVAPEQHGKEMAELKQVCAEFEPAATAIAEQAAASPKPE